MVNNKILIAYLMVHVFSISQELSLSNQEFVTDAIYHNEYNYLFQSGYETKYMLPNSEWRLTSILSELWLEGSWSNYFDYSYFYDENNNHIETINLNWVNDDWHNYRRNLYEYIDGNLSEALVQEWFNDDWLNFNKRTINYDGNNESQVVFQHWNGSEWENFYQYFYTYDDNNDPIEILYQNWADSVWVNSLLHHTNYNQFGNQTEKLYQLWSDSTWINQHEDSFAYNTNHNTIEYLRRTWEDTIWINLSQRLYSYNFDGELTEIISRSWDENVWNNSQQISYFYYSDTLEYITQLWGGSSWENQSQYFSFSDSTGYRIQSFQRVWSTSGWENYSRTNFNYEEFLDINSDIINEVPYTFEIINVYPNPFNSMAEIQFSARRNGNYKLTVIDITGREIATLLNENRPIGNHTLSWHANDLPTGIYFIKIDYESMIATQKVLLIK